MYARLSDSDAEQARDDLIKTKGFFILPRQLFCSVRSRAPLDENLNETLEAVFQAIEDSAKGSDSEANFSGLFDDIHGSACLIRDRPERVVNLRQLSVCTVDITLLAVVIYIKTLRISLWKSGTVALSVCAVFACINSLCRAINAAMLAGLPQAQAAPWFCLRAVICYHAICWLFAAIAY